MTEGGAKSSQSAAERPVMRRPLRPLARILRARDEGVNPDKIERENIRIRHEHDRDAQRRQAQGRLLVLLLCFVLGYGLVAFRMGVIATTPSEEGQRGGGGVAILSDRADIVDRNGRVLATNMQTHALYAQMRDMVDARAAADGLARIFPDMDAQKLYEDFTGRRKFLWLRDRLSPEQMQQVHDLGEPGLLFGAREVRLYPNGNLAAHVLGGASFGEQSVRSAEVIGIAGVEKFNDDRLRDPARVREPLQLTLDLSAQAAAEQALERGVRLFGAKGGAAVVMDIHSGELLTLASYPSFDPNNRPVPLTEGDASDSPLFNRAVQGVYELGSVFKIFTAAQALELGLATPETIIDTKGPLTASGQRVRDFHDMPKAMSLSDVIVRSSNVGTGRVALQIGATRQKDFLTDLGLAEPTGIEMIEASGGRPQLPRRWSDISTVTISYGHGISVSPLHLAQAYARLLNGGKAVSATLLRDGGSAELERVVSENTSRQSRDILRQVVIAPHGTASFGEVPGYEVGGKTGTADKVKPRGGYYEDKVIATFASVLPVSDPKYVVVVTLDEPEIEILGKTRRTAGFTAVPVAAELIRRVAPILGLRPDAQSYAPVGASLTAPR